MHPFLKLAVIALLALTLAVINRNFVEGCGGCGPCK